MQQEYKKQDVYREITDAIVRAIEQNPGSVELPWHRGGASHDRPRNAYSGKAYSGVNVLTLWLDAEVKRYSSDLWATYKQWEMLGAYVQKGEKGSPIVFYKRFDPKPSEEAGKYPDSKPRFYARTSKVFNAHQVKDFEPPKLTARNLVEVIQTADKLVSSTGADIRHGGDTACYNWNGDYIRMPDKERFTGTSNSTPTEAYYAVLFHELTHWSGHDTRLKRDLKTRFNKNAYAMEELVAELGAAFLCAELKVSNSHRLDHAAYIANWLEVFKNDKKAVFTAARKASEAADYLAKLDNPAPAPKAEEASSEETDDDTPY